MNRTVDRGTLTIAYVVLGLGALVALLPLALMLVSALKTSAEIVANPLALPQIPQWQNFLRAWKDAELGTSLLNSVKVTGLTVVLICVTGSMAAHALTRQRARGSRWISVYFLATTTLPIQLYLFPLYFGFAKLNLVDSVVATSLIYTAIYSPFSIFLLRTYFLAIPVEVEEAALMDGAKPWQVFSFITLPLVSPGVLTVAVIAGLNTWNEFLISTTFLQARTAQTAVVRFYMLGGQYSSDWGEIMAAALIIVAPMVVFFLLMQRRFIEGMASGSVKG
ncbi:carbohydrate ABC transporter permease [Caballeronia mineralivorans]|jgi:raffinose/stachyose/melibiose transport system permease protein|uniref:carbohydrate ABC transporter permease n=1 Tax=Caballeronia mineralivorans TaxID=2010198 RepID=UPI0023F260C3|nr:carbohydrate ABC transporter permease [Caballeronia mineralivorans]MDB5789199.1 Carbohydrate transporter rane protein 2, family [Caballeronia mineralivorans]MEA3096883.1 raffinose/stachyose/melibiose transport system permease protein [Caballeronia mineralivorans]